LPDFAKKCLNFQKADFETKAEGQKVITLPDSLKKMLKETTKREEESEAVSLANQHQQKQKKKSNSSVSKDELDDIFVESEEEDGDENDSEVESSDDDDHDNGSSDEEDSDDDDDEDSDDDSESEEMQVVAVAPSKKSGKESKKMDTDNKKKDETLPLNVIQGILANSKPAVIGGTTLGQGFNFTPKPTLNLNNNNTNSNSATSTNISSTNNGIFFFLFLSFLSCCLFLHSCFSHWLDDKADSEEDDMDVFQTNEVLLEMKKQEIFSTLFKNCTFYLGREVPNVWCNFFFLISNFLTTRNRSCLLSVALVVKSSQRHKCLLLINGTPLFLCLVIFNASFFLTPQNYAPRD
jgi:hypothetical protein